MEITVVYDDNKDREYLELIIPDFPFFINYINASKEKSEGYRIKSHWGAIKNPFVEIKEEDKTIKVFYSEKGENAIQQLVNWIKNDCKN